MSGGWSKQGSGVPLSERVRVGAGGADVAGEAVPEVCPVRHCWVADAADAQGTKRPGMLVEWRQVPRGWEGRVLYAARLRADSWALVEEWLPAALLTPM